MTQNKKKTKQSKPPLHGWLNWKAKESFKGRRSALRKTPNNKITRKLSEVSTEKSHKIKQLKCKQEIQRAK